MTFDRSKWKAAPLTTVTQTASTAKQYNTYYDGNNEYAPFWKQRDGVVVKRVLPAHKPGDSPYVPMLTAMLKIEVDDKNDKGEVIGKKVANKKIFLATLHGGYPYDIIEEYIKRVYEAAEEYQDKDERNRFLNPVTGYRAGGQWVPGIRPQLEYIFYAYIEGKIYRDTLRQKQMEALNKESAELCAQNDTAAIDMFSDPNTGFPIQWTREKDGNNKTVETFKALPLKMGQSWDDYFTVNAVPDKVLEDLEKLPSLQSIYVNSYTKSDFDKALEGLKRFDEANGYRIFAQDDFLDMVEKLQAMVEEKSGEKQPKEDKELPWEEKPTATPASPVAAPTPARKPVTRKKEEGVSDAEKLRVVNKEFIEQYGDEYEELELEGAELEEAYQLALAHKDLGYDIPHVAGWVEGGSKPKPVARQKSAKAEEVAPAPAAEEPAQASSSGQSALERIRAMRAKLGK